MIAAGRAEQLLRLPFDLIEWPPDVDADRDEPIAGKLVFPCCPICHAPRRSMDGYPSCIGAPMPYIAGQQPRPEPRPRPVLCRLMQEKPRNGLAPPRRRGAAGLVSLEQLRLAHRLYASGLSLEELAGRVWRPLGYGNAGSCARALRQQFHRHGMPLRNPGRRRRAA